MNEGFKAQVVMSVFVLSLLLGAFIVVGTNTVSALQDGDYTYELSGSPEVATITGYTGAGGAIEIPSTLGGYETVAIGGSAFINCTNVTSVVMPDSLVSIGGYSFYKCVNLTSVVIGSSVMTIGGDAFAGSVKLASVNIPDSVISIGFEAFANCTSLVSVDIGGNVTAIGDKAFSGCLALTSVSIPSNVASLGNDTFTFCPMLTAIDADPDNPNYASIDGVLYNKALTTLIQYPGGRAGPFTVPGSVTTIRDYAFSDCYTLTSVTIPNSVTTIGQAAFFACTMLTSVNIPNGVTSIANDTFAYCDSLTSVIIPGGVTIIGDSAFYYCSDLTSVTFLGLLAPASVGADWITGTSAAIEGHAYAASNFPTPGDYFYDLLMGDVIPVPGVPTNLSATPGNAQVTLEWIAPGDSGIVTNYQVYRAATENGTYALIASPSEPSYVDTGLNNGQTYWFNVSAVNEAGESPKTEPKSASPFTVPDAPTGMRAVAGDTQVALNWTAPAFDGGRAIDYYVVYQDDVALPDHPTGLSVMITGLENGEDYSFSVSAHNIAGTGAKSPVAAATPRTIPNVPTGLTAVAGNAQVALNWTAPAYNGGSVITAYNVYRAATENGTYVLTASPTGLNYTDTGLTNGETYWYTVSAVNIAGVGPSTTPLSSMPLTVPGVPTGLSAMAGNAQATLNWTAPSSDGGSAITGYKVYRASAENGTYVLIASPVGLNYTDADLTNGETYWYEVSAINAAGEGEGSGAASSTPFTVPDAPTGLTAVDGDAQVALNWTAPAFDGGRAIEYYVVYQDGVALPDHPTGLTATITGLENGEDYSFTVAAHNLAGDGAESSAVAAEPYTVPGAPTGLTGVAGNGQVTLNWTEPAFDGGRDIDYYVVYQDDVALPDHPTGLTVVIIGLNNGQTFSFAVAAHNTAGLGEESEEASATPRTVPDAPTLISAVPGDRSITVTWEAPADDGGSPIMNYTVYWDTDDPPEANSLSCGPTVFSIELSGLTAGTTYYVSVTAVSEVGESAKPVALSAVPYTVPDAPTLVSADAGPAQVTLIWSPNGNGGSPITGYNVYRSTTEDGTYDLIASPSGLNYTDDGLTNGQTYWYTVAAVNAAGEGAESAPTSSTPFTVPDAPTELTAVAGDTQVALSWTAPAFDGGRAIDYYVVYQDGAALPDHPTGLTAVIAGLTAGQEYNFTVAAHNLAGIGIQSEAASSIPFTVPDAPTGLVAVAGDARVTLNWTAPAYDGFQPVDYYVIYQDGVALPDHPTGLTAVIDGRSNGRNYTYTVAAHNLAGNGTESSAAYATPMPAPSVPTELTAESHYGYIVLSWAPSASGDAANYLVFRGTTTGGEDATPIAQVPAGTHYQDNAVTLGSPYYYKVKANNSYGQSDFSNEASGTAMAQTVPSAPQAFTATAGTNNVTLIWQAPGDNGGSDILSYQIYRSTGGGAFEQTGLVNAGILTYEDTNVTAGTNYTYYVKAVNGIGAGAQSAMQSATPLGSGGTTDIMPYVIIGIVLVIIVLITGAYWYMRRRKMPKSP